MEAKVINNDTKQVATLKGYFSRDDVQSKFKEMLGRKAQGFIISVLQIASNNSNLSTADPVSIYNAAATAATMDLPINPNLGFAWIVPYKGAAQFQMGYKGFIQLAQRSGQYLRLNVLEVYENQFKSWNALKEELDADFSIDGAGKIVGYVAYFKMINGFEKIVYWTYDKVFKHAKKYSKSFHKETSLWQTDFDKMAKKTVLKALLSGWGILSIEMQKAIVVDQAIINNEEGTDVTYPDNDELNQTEQNEKEQVETDRAKVLIEDATTLEELEKLHSIALVYKLDALYQMKLEQLSGSGKK